MCSPNLQPTFLIQQCLIKNRLIGEIEGWTYHVTCEASDQLGNRVELYDGRAECIVFVSDKCNQEEQFHASACSVPHSTADVAPVSAEFLYNSCSLPSEEVNLHDIEVDSLEQASLKEEPSYLTDSHTYDSTQPVEYLIKDRLIGATEGLALYDGRAGCIVSDECNQEKQFHASDSSASIPTVPHSTADIAPVSAQFLDNSCSLPSEGVNFYGIDVDSFEQACLMEEPSYLTDRQTKELQWMKNGWVNKYNGNKSTQYTPSSNAVDMLASALHEHIPDDILQFALSYDQNYFVADNNAFIEETLFTENQISNIQPTIISLEENSGDGKDLEEICMDQETNQAMNDEVEKYTEESLDHIALTDSPSSKTKGKHTCRYCRESFPSLLKLRSHQRIKHNKEYVEQICDVHNLICHRCNRKFSCREHWQSHILAHTDPDLECPICTKVLGSKASMKAHKKIHERKFSCEFCIKTFETDAQLRSHSLEKHALLKQKNKKVKTSSLSGDNEEDEEVDGDVDHVGLVAVDPTEDLEDGVIYYDNNEDVQYNLEVESFEIIRGNDSSEELESAYKTVSDIMKSESRNCKSNMKKKLTRDCRKCEKHFDRDSDYKRHSIEHVVQETLRCAKRNDNDFHVFRCRLCEGNCFRSVDQLRAHLRNHLKMSSFQCNKCPKTFSDSSNYSKHKKVHKTTAYQCDTCKRQFHTRKMIKQHMDYHKKTKPLPCSYCDKVFYFESTLQKHMKSHDKTKSKTAFSCQICFFKFPSMKHKWDHEWKEHGTRKTVNDCSECDIKFRKKSELKRHLKHNHNH